jgi:hypothetical protein
MRFTGFLPFEPRFGEGMTSTAVAVHLRTRVGNKQASLLAWLACLIINQASQQAERPDLGKQAS